MIKCETIRNKKITVFGTGIAAIKSLVFLNDNGIKVDYFLNNNRKIDKFCNLPVLNPDYINIKDTYIIISCLEETYKKIATQLNMMGCIEFDDFIFHEWLYKDIVLLHGNCHMEIIRSYLLSVKEFTNQFSIYPLPLIHCMKGKKIDRRILENSDVWIHEDIRIDNWFGEHLSDQAIRKEINKNVVEIIIPHLFGMGKMFFPQATSRNKMNKAVSNNNDINGMFPYADFVIDRLIEEGKTVEEIIEICLTPKAISEEIIRDNFLYYMEKLKERNKDWDIEIYDFIISNYKTKKLFYDPGHPTNEILKKITEEILNRLKIKYTDLYTKLDLSTHELPIYPCVKKYLDLQFNEYNIRSGKTGKKARELMDIKEYIKEYIWWCYDYELIR